ncbi:WYL domain-containing protein [Oscillibacter valericigenes]|uniref:helix-turn-helix transcriptional regulator n=1 Tax=Oscillibacter valericigenes TaxID=351091 RepID=UPI001F3FBF74|nr:WYL domain-containing protein [Oscillibacter valericigenes]MCF2617771.1 WYL domain-containing protein [Oscillibacter valericigenes]
MARSSYQKLKPLYIMNYLLQNTDEDHPVTVNQIISYLDSQGISAERKSIYSDIEALQYFGLDIVQSGSGRSCGYYIAHRTFELPELKLLVDSVQSSKFITHKKTAALIKKIETLASIHEAQLLNRQVFVKNRIKTMNESIYYNVDEIHNGISKNKKIRFLYFEYNVQKERQYRRNGAYYVVSPFALTWDDENYYMVAYDSDAAMIKHYRVDKMEKISILEEDRDGLEAYQALDMAIYARKTFGMFTGKEEHVVLRFENHLVGAVLDRLGRDVFIVPDGPDHFTVRTDVIVSPQFFAWVTGFGTSAQVIGPGHVVEAMKDHICAVAGQYGQRPEPQR